MAPRFFELSDDVHVPHRWHLKNPADRQGCELDNPWQFTDGRALHFEERLKVPIEHAGRPLDFTLAGLSIPVVHINVASVFTELAPGDVQLIPVDIDGQPDQYLILVAIRLIQCIDEQASRIRLWTHQDGVPHKVGQYKSVRGMRIDKQRVGNARVFRPEGWDVDLIVSHDIKEALERLGATGVRFEEV
jgi:hypothetical protein